MRTLEESIPGLAESLLNGLQARREKAHRLDLFHGRATTCPSNNFPA
jgi:hypothetical protein